MPRFMLGMSDAGYKGYKIQFTLVLLKSPYKWLVYKLSL